MTLSLKWKIQLWHALILASVLSVLGVGFYYYEKAHRLDEVDDQINILLHPTVGPLEQSIRRSQEGGHHRREGGPRRSRPPAQLQRQSPEEAAAAAKGGWVRRERNQSLVPSQAPRENDSSSLPTPHRDLEENFVPFGYYARAERLNGDPPSFQTSNFPGVELPAGLGRGVFFRLRDNRFREAYHRMPMFHVLVGADLAQLEEDLGQLKWQITSAALLLFGLGISVGYFLVSRSIQPLTQIESVAEKIADGELSQRIPEGKKSEAKELKHLVKNLNHTFTQLETAFEKQLRFTADASHELRTPLTALRAQIEHGMKRSRSGEEYAKILDVCKRSSERIQKITEQLIELSSYDSGKVELDLEEVLLEPMLISLAEELTPYVEEQGHTLLTDLAPGELTCDQFRLEQVITNLINNAVQHNQAPTTITLRCRIEANDCHIEIIDTGKGIQSENLDKLFDRFFQESSSRTKTSGETNVGLGLAVSQAIVQAHQGRIEIESETSLRTVFRIILPLGNPQN